MSALPIFCLGNDFFAYPNNYNYYVNYYKNTFQHGGISMEEMLIPIVTMNPKKIGWWNINIASYYLCWSAAYPYSDKQEKTLTNF